MSKTRIRRPASDIRPARRSLVELTAAASRAIDDGLLVTSASLIAASPDNTPRSEPAAKTHDRTMVAGQVKAPIPVAVPEPLNEALDHAKDFAETRVGSEGALKGHGGAILENNFLTVLKGTAAEFHAEALEL